MRLSAGFTLIEMIVVMIIISILGAMMAPVLREAVGAYGAANAAATTLDKLRYASTRLALEIRGMTGGSITTMAATTLKFSTVDYVPAAVARTVTIDRSGGNLRLAYSNPSTGSYVPVLTDQLESILFSYFDQNGMPASMPSAVRYVEYTITLRAPSGPFYAETTRVSIRNH